MVSRVSALMPDRSSPTYYKHTISYFQILDLGLIMHSGSYLRDVWNVMDSLVVSCALVSIYFQ